MTVRNVAKVAKFELIAFSSGITVVFILISSVSGLMDFFSKLFLERYVYALKMLKQLVTTNSSKIPNP